MPHVPGTCGVQSTGFVCTTAGRSTLSLMAPAAGAKAKSPTTDAVINLMNMRFTFMPEPLNNHQNGVFVGPPAARSAACRVTPTPSYRSISASNAGRTPLSGERGGASGSTAGKHCVGITGVAAPWSARRPCRGYYTGSLALDQETAAHYATVDGFSKEDFGGRHTPTQRLLPRGTMLSFVSAFACSP